MLRVQGRQHCVAVRARASNVPPGSSVRINIHGRHVQITEPLARHVETKLQGALDKFKGAEFLEGEGGVRDVDVKLMNSQCEVKVRPLTQNKHMHDTFLRQGELKVLEFGDDVYECLDKAVNTLEKKLHKYGKPAPSKKDYRKL